MIELFLYGNQIATYATLSSSGNSNGVQVALGGIETLGGANDVIRVVVRQVNSGQTAFQNGQMVDFYEWPSNTPIAQNLNPQHDQFQGRASSGSHQIFTNQRFVINLDGFSGDTIQFGPGASPPRNETLTFDALLQDPPPPPCFVAGTPILTPDGWQDVRSLVAGDLVETLDHGPQPILWRKERTVSGHGDFAPVCLKSGLVGNRSDLLLSPHHRVLLAGPRVEFLFFCPEVLVQAHHLLPLQAVERREQEEVTYVHLLFEDHEILCADGAPAESLLLGQYTVERLVAPNRHELETFLSDGRKSLARGQRAARRCLKKFEADMLIQGADCQDWPGFQRIAA